MYLPVVYELYKWNEINSSSSGSIYGADGV